MKHIATLALAALLVSPLAFAEKPAKGADGKDYAATCPKDGMMGGGMMMEHLDQRAGLNLDDKQKQQVKAIMDEQRKKQEAIRNETHQRIAAVLTPEQRKKFDEHHANMMDKRGDRMEKRADRMEKRADRMHQHAEQHKEMQKDAQKEGAQ